MAGRRRARAKRKTFRLSDSSDVGFTSDEDANIPMPRASTSNARGKQKAVAKSSGVRITKRGKLGMIAEMPLDVLYEVGPSLPLSVTRVTEFVVFAHRYSPS
jgi:hypothetical protein